MWSQQSTAPLTRPSKHLLTLIAMQKCVKTGQTPSAAAFRAAFTSTCLESQRKLLLSNAIWVDTSARRTADSTASEQLKSKPTNYKTTFTPCACYLEPLTPSTCSLIPPRAWLLSTKMLIKVTSQEIARRSSTMDTLLKEEATRLDSSVSLKNCVPTTLSTHQSVTTPLPMMASLVSLVPDNQCASAERTLIKNRSSHRLRLEEVRQALTLPHSNLLEPTSARLLWQH